MKIKITVIVLALSMDVTAARVAAQNPPDVTVRSDVVIGADDGVTIVVADSDELSKAWRVNSSGDLTLPMVGEIHAAGMTSANFETELRNKLKSYIRDPQVTAYVSETRSQPVIVQGAVPKPGTVQMDGSKTLLGVLMQSGGPNPTGSATAAGPTVTVTRDMKYGTIPFDGAKTDEHGHYSTVELKLKDVLKADSHQANLLLMPHDTVSVSTKQRLVYVIGQVTRPGAVELDTQDTVSVMQVLAAAGGVTDLASPSHTMIMHVNEGGKYTRIAAIDVNRLLSGKSEDRLLSPGDVLVVPQSHIKSYLQTAATAATSAGAYAVIMHF